MAESIITGETPAPSARAIADQAPIGIYRADADGLITYINPALERLSGVSSARALGESWLQASPPDARDEAERLWKSAVADRRDLETEFRFRHSDGSLRTAAILMAANYLSDGGLAGFTGFVTDVTAQRADQEALRDSERLYRLLAENATDIIVRLDLDDHVTYASPAMGEVTGFSAEETRGINPISFMHPDDADAAKECSRQLKAGEIEQGVIEYRTPRKSGGYIWVEARSRLVRNSKGEPQEVISVVRNISEHKRLESDLITAREAERQAAAAQGRFLAAMSHEIRTPISGVIGMIDLMINNPDDAQQPRYRDALAASARTLLRVVDDVLDYSRANQVGITLEREPFDVFATVHAVIDLYRPAALAKNLIVGLQFQSPARVAVGDATRISQVLGNLMSNAIKFTQVGRIDVEVEQSDDVWRFAVSDTGIGLSTEQQARLFEAFAQADDSIAAQYGGSGLGLTLSRLIVEASGGSLTVESQSGQGATFAFILPLAAPEENQEAPLERSRKRSEMKALRTLVADDNEINLLYLERLLGDLGHHVAIVRDGQAAVEAAAGAGYEIILMDRHMPRLNGIEAARAIRSQSTGHHPLLVLVSAAGVQSAEDKVAEAGLFDAELPKPVRPQRLAEVLANLAPSDVARSKPSDDLRAAIGASAAEKLLRLFRVDIEMRALPIANAIEAGDVALLRGHAHAISGAASLIGENRIADAAIATELASPDRVVAEAQVLARACTNYLRGLI